MLNYFVKFTTIVALVVLIHSTAIAEVKITQQKKSEADIRASIKASLRSIRIVKTKVNRVLPKKYKRDLKRLNIEISRDHNIFAVFATRKDRKISISFSFIDQIIAVVDAVILADFLGNRDMASEYLFLLIENMIENTNNYKQGKSFISPPHFAVYAGMSNQKFSEITSTPGYAEIRDDAITDAIGFVLLHEIAHHVLGHVNKKNSIAHERDADSFSLKYGVKAGLEPMFGVLPFWYYSAIEEAGVKLSEKHPSPMCRTSKFLRKAFDLQREDKKYMRYLKDTGQYTSYKKMKKTTLKKFTKEC
jgi:hypothetical protein